MIRSAPKVITCSLKQCTSRTPYTSTKSSQLLRSAAFQSLITQRNVVKHSVRHLSSKFGSSSPEEKPWGKPDSQFSGSHPCHFGSPTPDSSAEHEALPRSQLSNAPLEGEQQNLDPDLKPSPYLEILNLSPTTQRAELRKLCEEFAPVSSILFPTRSPSFCRIHFHDVKSVTKAMDALKTHPIFTGPPKMRIIQNNNALETKYLFIQNYKGTKEELEEALSSFPKAMIHVVPIEVPGNQLRIDAFINFAVPEEATKAKDILRNMRFSPSKIAPLIQSVEPSRYYAAVSSTQKGSDMVELLEGGKRSHPPHQSPGPSTTLFLGNIPIELLNDKEQILEKFSRYGQLVDVRIPDEGTKRPRGYMYLEYHRQEDADALHQDLKRDPLILFGRQVRIDYADPSAKKKSAKESKSRGFSDRTVYISPVPYELTANPLELEERLSQHGKLIDLRISKSDRIPIGVVFAQYIDYDNAENAIKAINDVESPLLGSAIRAQFATKDRVPDWTRLHIPPSDTIRLWNVPSLALRSKDLLRRAFSHQQGLLDIRIPLADGFPWGTAYLQFTTVEAAKDAFNWIRSDLENPITFFGRPMRAHYAEADTRWPVALQQMSSRSSASPRRRDVDEKTGSRRVARGLKSLDTADDH